jgi:tetratricopeptide (TPR) repeat protein
VWAALLRRRERLAAGEGGLTLLEGLSGVGKSTVLGLLAEESTLPEFRVAVAKASWSEVPPPFQVVSDALKSLAVGPKAPPGPVADAAASAPLAFQPAVERARTRFTEMDPLGSMDEDAPSELASDRLRLFGTLLEPILAASEETPVLMLLDDLHRADDSSRAFLTYAVPRIAKRSVWILAACDLPKSHAHAGPDPLHALRIRDDVGRLALRPLTEAEVAEFVRWALPESTLPEAEVHRLHAKSGGVPFRIVRLLSPSAAGAKSTPAAEGSAPVEDVPAGHPESEARRVLQLALVAGPEIPLKTVAAAAELSEAATAEHLDHWVVRRLLHHLEPGRYAFDQEESRDSLIARMSSERIRQCHRKLAEALLKEKATDVTVVYALARHTYLGGMDREAIEYNERAAVIAAESFQPEVSLLYLRLALEVLTRFAPDDAPTELRLRMEIAVQQAHIGPSEAAELLLAEIRNSERLWEAAGPVERALIGVYRARVLADEGRWDEAEVSLSEMPQNLRGLDRGDIPRLAYRLQGEILYYRGSYPEALDAHEAALVIAEETGEPREVAAELIRRATVLSMIPGREEEAIEEFRTAIDRLMELGDQSEAALGTLGLGVQLHALGRTDEARAALQRCVALSEAANDLRRSGWAHLNLADLEFGLNHPEEATAEVRKARAHFEHVDDALGTARAALTEARLEMARGATDEVANTLEVARTIFQARHLTADELEVDLRSAELEDARGDALGARKRLEKIVQDGLVRLRPDLIEEGRRLASRLGDPVVAIE